MDPGAVLLALLGSAEPRLAPRGLRAVRLDRPGEHGRGARPRRGRHPHQGHDRRRSSPRPTRTRRSARSTRGSGAALSVAEATRNVAITGARPLGVTNCLNYGDPTRPEAFWQLQRGASAASATRAGRSACRSPAATSRSTTSRRAGAIAPTPEIGVVGLLEDVALAGRPGVRGPPATRSLLVGEATPGLAGSEYARARRARAPRTARRRSTSRARRRSRRSSARRPRAACSRRAQDVSGGGLAVALAEAAIWATATRGATLRLPVASSPAVDLFGESPSRLVVSARAAPRAGARRCSRASTACRSRSSAIGRRRRGSSIELAGAGATGAAEERGSARRRRARRRRSTSSATPGSTACRARSAGTSRRGAADVRRVRGRRCPPGSRHRGRGRSPRSGLFALQHRGQESAGVAVSDGEQLMLYKDLGMIASVLDERRLPSLRGDLAIAHCRYSTTGSTVWENAQPTFRLGPRRALAIGHNGNLVNTRELLEPAARRPRPPARARPTRSC